jgi:hypothetical protein
VDILSIQQSHSAISPDEFTERCLLPDSSTPGCLKFHNFCTGDALLLKQDMYRLFLEDGSSRGYAFYIGQGAD